MKVNQFNRIGTAYQAYQKHSEQTKAQDTKKKVQYEQVEISEAAKKQLEQKNGAKIERLKQEIANGTYQIDSGKLAEKILAAWKNGTNVNE